MLCQACDHDLTDVLSLGYAPPVNDYVPVGSDPREQLWMPLDLKHCPKCELVQLGYQADPKIVFPPSYPYTSGTTKLLHDNFADLARESARLVDLEEKDLVVDIGSNDGTLLSKFQGHRVLGIEPTDTANIAKQKGIPTIKSYFSADAVDKALTRGEAKIVTCANCFAHMPDVHGVIENVKRLMRDDGVFITESHYLMGLLRSLQYDTIYHEHLRYYSLTSLKNLLAMHGLEVFYARPIPSHGGSIRVYAAFPGRYPMNLEVGRMLAAEPRGAAMEEVLRIFSGRVQWAQISLLAELHTVGLVEGRVAAVGAPSRASTVINYCGIDNSMIEYVCEVQGSLKIGKNMPGTSIPVIEESKLFADQPSHVVLFSWHIAGELIPKLRAKGYRGKFIMPCSLGSTHAEAA